MSYPTFATAQGVALRDECRDYDTQSEKVRKFASKLTTLTNERWIWLDHMSPTVQRLCCL